MSEMTPGELADKMEGWWMDSEPSEHRTLILKSLRFAADMEYLWRTCPNHVTIYNVNSMGEQAWITAGTDGVNADSGFHDDIYSAARAAVEALKGRV